MLRRCCHGRSVSSPAFTPRQNAGVAIAGQNDAWGPPDGPGRRDCDRDARRIEVRSVAASKRGALGHSGVIESRHPGGVQSTPRGKAGGRDMRGIKAVALSLVVLGAVFAWSATAASASTPEWWECASVPGPLGANCVGPGTSHKRQQGIGNPAKVFKGKGAPAVLHNASPFGDVAIECGTVKTSGQVAVPNKEYGVQFVFKKCTAFGQRCQTPGAHKGEIKTNMLAGELGWIKTSINAGVDLENPSGNFLEFTCSFIFSGRTFGSVIGEITPFGTGFTKFETVNYATIGGLQSVTQFQSGSPDTLETEFCGAVIKEKFGEECVPPWASGLQATVLDKGEYLEIA